MTVFASDLTRKARKEHRCWFCNLKIMAGDTYEYRSGVDCGDFWDMHMHPSCNEIAKKHFQPEDYEDREPYEFREKFGIPHPAKSSKSTSQVLETVESDGVPE